MFQNKRGILINSPKTKQATFIIVMLPLLFTLTLVLLEPLTAAGQEPAPAVQIDSEVLGGVVSGRQA